MYKLTSIFATLCLLTGAATVQAAADKADVNTNHDVIGAPGIIPHPIESYLPITANKNTCLMCHKNASSEKRKSGEIPMSHIRNGKVTGDRWNCKCSLAATNEPPTGAPRGSNEPKDQPSPGLDNNPGVDGKLFRDTHPYIAHVYEGA